MNHRSLLVCLAALAFSASAVAEDGYDLWLRYRSIDSASYPALATRVRELVSGPATPTLAAVERELQRGLSGMSGAVIPVVAAPSQDGSVLFGTPRSSPAIAALALDLGRAGAEGYVIRSLEVNGHSVTAIAANSDVGVLYGAFHFLRLIQTRAPLLNLDIASQPRTQIRLLNHWDNLDGHVERGYSGQSIWDWHKLPLWLDPRYTDYARACASIGINGAVLTNVNANATSLTPAYLEKAAALAGVLRPYGVRVYLTARFSAPIELGGLKTADPLDPAVRAWWKAKIDEIYRFIPDFGGFLVKANSEGQPGPQDYKRSHADGANMLAEPLAAHGGIVMWRAFVYSNDTPTDRAKQAFSEFVPLDGKFAANVVVQVKNGAIDFQPREPFHPLFGGMTETPMALELQITKEYLGEDTHLAYLGPLYEEVLKADTQVKGAGSTVARVIDGALEQHTLTAISGVANIGSDTNWTGSHFNQANWYVYGRMAWDPEISAQSVATEWVGQTFSNDPVVVTPVVGLMMSSRQTLVNYMEPLGLVHIMGTDHHYGPKPWESSLSQPEWNPVYYHKADTAGLGFDRTATGSNAVSQYAAPVGQAFGDRAKVSDDSLLFFHHVGWGEMLDTNKTLWEELVRRYSQGVDDVGRMRDAWTGVKARIDGKRFGEVSDFLQIQHYEARWWRDACLTYFATFSKLPIPAGYAMPQNPLSFYQGLNCPPDVKKPRCPQVYTGSPSPAVLP